MSKSKYTKLFIVRYAETDKNNFKRRIINQNQNFQSSYKKKRKKGGGNQGGSFYFDLTSSLSFEKKNCRLNHNGGNPSKILADYFDIVENNICAVYSSL